MPKVITFATLKGGAGKTMNIFNLAGVIAARGKKILLLDIDPQCNRPYKKQSPAYDQCSTLTCGWAFKKWKRFPLFMATPTKKVRCDRTFLPFGVPRHKKADTGHAPQNQDHKKKEKHTPHLLIYNIVQLCIILILASNLFDCLRLRESFGIRAGSP